MKKRILLVDGYNMIAFWKEMRIESTAKNKKAYKSLWIMDSHA